MDQVGLARMVIAHLEIRPSGIRPNVSKPIKLPTIYMCVCLEWRLQEAPHLLTPHGGVAKWLDIYNMTL